MLALAGESGRVAGKKEGEEPARALAAQRRAGFLGSMRLHSADAAASGAYSKEWASAFLRGYGRGYLPQVKEEWHGFGLKLMEKRGG